MKKGDIVLIPFPFTDLSGNKLRPALVLISGKADVTVAFITTQMHWKEPNDVIVSQTNQKRAKAGISDQAFKTGNDRLGPC